MMAKTLPLPVFFRFILLIICSCSAFGQTTNNNGCVVSGFGINAWLYSNQTQVVSPIPPAGSVDWFAEFPTPGGRNVIDQTNPAAITAILNGSPNPTYERRMSANPITVADNVILPNGNRSYKILIDAVWAKDMFGGSGAIDESAYQSSNKNAQDPAIWDIGPSNVLGKNDLMDVGGHMFRDVETASGTGAVVKNDLWFVGLIHRSSPGGAAYMDFEFLVNDVTITGTGSNQRFTSGGQQLGHTAYTFEPDPLNPGKHRVSKIGDVILNTSLINGGTEVDVESRIWVSRADRLSITPTNFAWGPNYDGAFNGSAYVYAEIIATQQNIICGAVNRAGQNPSVAPWGARGTNGNIMITNHIDFSIAEMSINLTALGLDHASLSGVDPCFFPLNTFIVKTRLSTAFTSELKDYAGPFSWGKPKFQLSSNNNLLSCQNEIVTILAGPQRNDVNFLWSTLDGNILNVTPYTPPLSQPFGNSLLVDPNDTNIILGVINETELWKITVDSPGTYTMNGMLLDGCLVPPASLEVGLDPTFPLFNGPPTFSYTVPCNTNDGTITTTASGATKPYTFFLYKDNVLQTQVTKGIAESSHTFTGLTAGNYRVDVKGAAACVKTTGPITIPARIPVVISQTITNVNCFGNRNGAINLTVSGGNPPLSYLWNTGNTSQNLLNIGAGSYTVNITDGDACVTTRNFTVTQPAAINGAITKVNDPGNAGNGSATISVTGGTSPYTYLWTKTGAPGFVFAPSNSAATVTNLSFGQYNVLVTDANGCTATYTVLIFEKEICGNGIDNDGDGLSDCDDPDCSPQPPTGITPSAPVPCVNDVVSYTAASPVGVVYNSFIWTVPNNATVVNQSGNPIALASVTGNVLYVKWQNTSGGQICVRGVFAWSPTANCESTATCINVVVNQVPQTPGVINVGNN